MRAALYLLGVGVMATAMQVSLGAIEPAAAPEIDGSSVVSALGLLSGGILVLRARLGR
jgi:hypothetical protein